MSASLLNTFRQLQPPAHLCSVFETEEEQTACTISFLRVGLEQGGKCVFIGEDEHRLHVIGNAMTRAGLDTSHILSSGALMFVTKEQAYFRTSSFDPRDMLTYWRQVTEQSRYEGYRWLWATCDTDWLRWGAPEGWLQYESSINTGLAKIGGCVGLCQYNRRLCTPQLLMDVIRTHPFVIYGNTVCQNFYFVPPEEFLGPDTAEREVTRLLHTLREHERTEQRLRAAEKMDAMGQLAGGIAHDFNNLMTIVTGYSELLSMALEGHSPLQDKVHEIRKAGEQARSLTQQLLAFARRQVVQPRLLTLNSVLADMGKMLRRLVKEDIELSIIDHSDRAVVRADRSQLEQVILNLVINARDAMPDGGRLVLSSSNTYLEKDDPRLRAGPQPGPYARLSVSDTGHGMDTDTRMRIFEPFFTTKEPGKGTGLGLATVYGIVEQAGGFISVASELGCGTSFDVYFPRCEEERAEPVQRAPAQMAGGSETILLVEDQDGLRTLVTEILKQYGYRVVSATNGREALRLMQQGREQVDLAITDLIMPQMGGRDMAQSLSASHPDMKILFMSGYVSNLSELLTDGCAFIDKPFTPEALLRKVREVLDEEQSQRRAA